MGNFDEHALRMPRLLSDEQYLDALLSLPCLGAVEISHDRKWVAWSWYGLGPAADVYVAPCDGSAPPARLTDTPQDSDVVAWGFDNRTLIVGEDRDGDERVRLFALDRARPGEMRRLTDDAPHYFLRGGALHPNGRWLFYAANHDPEARREIEPHYLFRHDLATGERRAIARPRRPNAYAPQLSDTGGHLLYSRKDLDPSGRQYWLVGVDRTDDREILNFGAATKAQASWMPDGRRIVVVAEAGGHKRLGVFDIETGTVRWLIDDPSRDIEYAYAPRGSSSIVLIETSAARSRATLVDPKSGLERPMVVPDVTFMPLAAQDDGAWIGVAYGARQPRDIVRFDPATPELARLRSLTGVWTRTTLRPDDFVAAEDFRWRAGDGLAIQGWLYRPDGPARGTIALVHGGPTAHSEARVNAQIQFLVRKGFNVLDPNYRGSTGFGLVFREAIKRDFWGGGEQDDIRAGIEALIAAGVARAGQIGITGTSYGGYSSWHAITRKPSYVDAAAPICGMTDLVVDYETTRPDLRPYSEEMMGGAPENQPQRYHDRSPIHFVHNIRGRVLIVQGMRDPNVTPDNVHAVRRALEEAGVRHEALAFEDEGHGIVRPANQRRLYLALARFFAEAFAAPSRVN